RKSLRSSNGGWDRRTISWLRSAKRSRHYWQDGTSVMPLNRFPDTAEKRELRRRDARLLRQYRERVGHELDYCGMPSVEFLDVEQWKSCIRSVVAVEYDPDVLEDVKIERDNKNFQFPVQVLGGDIL